MSLGADPPEADLPAEGNDVLVVGVVVHEEPGGVAGAGGVDVREVALAARARLRVERPEARLGVCPELALLILILVEPQRDTKDNES